MHADMGLPECVDTVIGKAGAARSRLSNKRASISVALDDHLVGEDVKGSFSSEYSKARQAVANRRSGTVD